MLRLEFVFIDGGNMPKERLEGNLWMRNKRVYRSMNLGTWPSENRVLYTALVPESNAKKAQGAKRHRLGNYRKVQVICDVEEKVFADKRECLQGKGPGGRDEQKLNITRKRSRERKTRHIRSKKRGNKRKRSSEVTRNRYFSCRACRTPMLCRADGRGSSKQRMRHVSEAAQDADDMARRPANRRDFKSVGPRVWHKSC